MATDRTEKLIVDLVADLAPVQRLPGVSVRMIRWLVAAVGLAAIAIWLFGLRSNLSAALATPDVLWSLGLAALASISAAVVSLRLSIPGAEPHQWLRWLPLVIVAAWAAILAAAAGVSGVPVSALIREPFHAACVVRVVGISLLPTLLLWRELRRGFALDAASAAALAALGGSALAALAVQLVCPIDREAHVLVSHVLPVVGLTMAAGAVVFLKPRLIRG